MSVSPTQNATPSWIDQLLKHVNPISVPASSSSPGVRGQWAVDTSYLYICVERDTWRRVGIGTF